MLAEFGTEMLLKSVIIKLLHLKRYFVVFQLSNFIYFQESHNIFSKLNHDEYRQVLGNIKHCILATDLALFFPNKARLSNILKEDAFSWDLPDHRYEFLFGEIVYMYLYNGKLVYQGDIS